MIKICLLKKNTHSTWKWCWIIGIFYPKVLKKILCYTLHLFKVAIHQLNNFQLLQNHWNKTWHFKDLCGGNLYQNLHKHQNFSRGGKKPSPHSIEHGVQKKLPHQRDMFSSLLSLESFDKKWSQTDSHGKQERAVCS